MAKIWLDMVSPCVVVAVQTLRRYYTPFLGRTSIVASGSLPLASRQAMVALGLLIGPLLLSGCDTLPYYLQAVGGEIDLLTRRKPVADLLANPATSPDLRARLLLAGSASDFAVNALALKPGGSFRSYADLERPYAVWSVFATPPLALEPLTWCFPIVGCMSYRGYFAVADARQAAAKLAAQGMDTYVANTPAFSTLGWFDDPLLNTFITWPEPWLVGLLFHEMTHATFYLPGDTTFNESYAEAVAQVGTERWLQQKGRDDLLAAFQRHLQRRDRCLALIQRTRALLRVVYASPRSEEARRAVKKRILATTRATYRRWATAWGKESEFAFWFADDLNNARLVALTTYSRWVPAFLALLEAQGGSMEKFHQAVRALAELPPEIRQERLSALRQQPRSVSEGVGRGHEP
ncbi:MAG: aminopeptidase [Magnetococcales bacterium]|nr:aminopeptidase [Magnetococcales bacterium]